MIAYSQSEENYLETLYLIQLKNDMIRVKDVAQAMDVKMPSVVAAIRSLSEKGLVVQEKYSHIELTEKGVEAAKDVYGRHKLLYALFHEILGLDPKIAENDACQMEHHLSPPTQERLIRMVEFIRGCKSEEVNFLKRLKQFINTGEMPGPCDGCSKY
mgnify:CR=1 FL=1